MGIRFVRWMNEELWTATGVVFDVGGTTASALLRIGNGTPAERSGGFDEHSNGNGSLMRILPVALRFSSNNDLVARIERTSAITHGHARSKMSCAFYSMVVRHLLQGEAPESALTTARAEFSTIYERTEDYPRFRRILSRDLATLPEGEVVSTGYVLDTLHASLWCLLTTSSFEECVLRAVNLGGDTDTTGCVAGGLAGVHYGVDAIPSHWKEALPRHWEAEQLFGRFWEVTSKQQPNEDHSHP